MKSISYTVLFRRPCFALRETLVSLTLCLLSACGGGGGGDTNLPVPQGPPPALTSGPQNVYHELPSIETGITYNLTVYLPAGYTQGSRNLPVVYAMDSESRFNPLTNVLQVANYNVILVGIGNMGGNRRFIDFVSPGADAYFRFITRELLPFIESRYRVDTGMRILSGHSLSGLFAMTALYMDLPADRKFAAIISGDGTFQADNTLAIREQAMYDRSHKLPVKIILAASLTGNFTVVSPLYSMMAARNYEGVVLREFYYTTSHTGMDVPSFSDAMAVILGPPG